MTTIIGKETKMKVRETAAVKTGVAAAALISSGVGVFVIGLMTTGAVLSEGLKNFLNWWNPAGPLTGKTGLGILAWLISWAIMNNKWKEQDSNLGKAFNITLILIVLGLLLTFPPVFEAFE
ncbi:MAG: hypothetical protein ACE5EY_03975 [Anaerolineae bacterium]